MSPDQRMLWIRGVEALRTAENVETLEAEFGSEAAIAGVLEYADGAILCSRITLEADSAGMYKYLLRLQLPGRPIATSAQAIGRQVKPVFPSSGSFAH